MNSSRRRVALAAGLLAGAVTACVAPSSAGAATEATVPAFEQVIGGSGAAELYPSGMEVGSDGTVVVANTGDSSVVAYTPAGEQLWRRGENGSRNGQFNNPRDIGIDSLGNVYVADTANLRIVKLSPAGDWLGSWRGTTADPVKSPIGLSVHGDLVYVADGGAKKVRVFTTDGTPVRAFGSNGACTFAALRDVDADDEGNVYVANYTLNNILKLSATGTCLTKWGSKGAGEGQFANPYGVRLATDPVTKKELVYVADSNNERIQVFTSTGGFVASMGVPGDHDQLGTFTQLRRVAVAPDGDVWGADLWGWRVVRFDRTASGWTAEQQIGSTVPQLTDEHSFNEPRQIAFDPAGNLVVADTVHHRVVRYTPDGHVLGSCGMRGSDDGELNWPRGVAIDPVNGDIWLADTKQSRIQVTTAACTNAVRLGKIGTATGQFNWPMSVAIRASDRTAWVADTNNSRITVWDVATRTALRTYGTLGSGVGQFNQPRGISVAPDGSIWVADRSNGRVVQLQAGPGGTDITWVRSLTGGFNKPEGVASDAAGRIYVADTLNDRMVVLAADGSLSGATSEPGGVQDPAAVAVGPDGRIYLADTFGDRVIAYRWAGVPDTQAPSATITSPATNATVHLPLTITGASSDNVGVALVQWAVKDRSTNTWWNPTTGTWGARTTWSPATLTSPGATSSTWSASFAPVGGSGKYVVQARAVDAAGNKQATTVSRRFAAMV